jgi:hypothetical protein
MNSETKPATRLDGHPDENDLLLALERELPPEEIEEIEKHLGECWSCRARFEEMQRGILVFVEYREDRYLPPLEGPPNAFRSFPGNAREGRELRNFQSVPFDSQPFYFRLKSLSW